MPDVECATCKGKGKTTVRGKTHTCSECGGAGFYAVEESEMTEEMRDRVIE
jgi:DnaJ-class molecular chaperone